MNVLLFLLLFFLTTPSVVLSLWYTIGSAFRAPSLELNPVIMFCFKFLVGPILKFGVEGFGRFKIMGFHCKKTENKVIGKIQPAILFMCF